MKKEEEILNAIFEELGVTTTDRKKNRNSNEDYKGKWPIFEVQGGHGKTWDVFETEFAARNAIKSSRLQCWTLYQINEHGIKVKIDASSSSFVRNNNPFTVLKGHFKHVA